MEPLFTYLALQSLAIILRRHGAVRSVGRSGLVEAIGAQLLLLLWRGVAQCRGAGSGAAVSLADAACPGIIGLGRRGGLATGGRRSGFLFEGQRNEAGVQIRVATERTSAFGISSFDLDQTVCADVLLATVDGVQYSELLSK